MGNGCQFKEGDIGVCGIAVLDNFSWGISVILISKLCNIAVFSEPAHGMPDANGCYLFCLNRKSLDLMIINKCLIVISVFFNADICKR